MAYMPYLLVTNEVPLIAGREIWGCGKNLAHVEVNHEHDQQIGIIERPTGNRLATAVMRPLDNVSAAGFGFPSVCCLKVIPSAEENKPPEVAQLVSLDFRVTPVVGTDGIAELWSGPGRWSTTLRPRRILAQARSEGGRVRPYGLFNGYVPYGKILERTRSAARSERPMLTSVVEGLTRAAARVSAASRRCRPQPARFLMKT